MNEINSKNLDYLLIFLISKKFIFYCEKINISLNDLLNYFLKKIEIKKKNFTEKDFINSLNEIDNQEIIKFFWSDSIINPTVPKYEKRRK